jgi:hypothetical protein
MKIIVALLFIICFNQCNLNQNNKLSDFKEIQIDVDDEIWITKNLQVADSLISKYHIDNYTDKYHPAILDKVFISCLVDLDNNLIEEEIIINALGSAFGSYLINNLNGKWMIYEDKQGTDLAVKLDDKIHAFPLSSVYKRIDTRETGFFESIYFVFAKEIIK